MRLSHQDSSFSERSQIFQIVAYIQLKNMGGSPGDANEEPVTQEKRNKGWIMSCDVREATERFENEL